METYVFHLMFLVPSGFRYLNEQYMPGLLTSENSETDADKLNARPEVLVCLFYFSFLVFYSFGI